MLIILRTELHIDPRTLHSFASARVNPTITRLITAIIWYDCSIYFKTGVWTIRHWKQTHLNTS
jgi:hypothetical protein